MNSVCRALTLSGWLLAALTACGSEDKQPTAAGGAGGLIAGAPGAGGTAAAGASMASGGASGAPAAGAPSGGAAAGGASGSSSALICPSNGVKLPTEACYIPCTYDFGSPPRYESFGGNCTRVGWRCSVYQYCDPNIHCADDRACNSLGGPGLVCVTSGPLVGECLIKCNTNADCPNSNGATTSPYVCQTIDTGAGVVHVCGI